MRVVLSWFPKYNLNELPWNIAAWPTEPILKPTRALVPPVAGVDVAPRARGVSFSIFFIFELEREEMGCGASTPKLSDAHLDMDISKHGGDSPDDVAFMRDVALAHAPATPE